MWSCTRCDYDVCRRCASKLVEAAPEEEREVREYRIEEEACRPCTSAAYTSAVGGHGGGGGGGGGGGSVTVEAPRVLQAPRVPLAACLPQDGEFEREMETARFQQAKQHQGKLGGQGQGGGLFSRRLEVIVHLTSMGIDEPLRIYIPHPTSVEGINLHEEHGTPAAAHRQQHCHSPLDSHPFPPSTLP